jgi:colanic acid biosynthesis protein WcaH
MINRETYKNIHSLMPIICTDLVIVNHSKILLIKRNLEPAKGQYWFPGGRIMKGESQLDAVNRIAHSEVGLNIYNLNKIGIEDLIFDTDPFEHNQGTHTVSIVFTCHTEATDPILDKNHSSYIWWDGSSGSSIDLHQHIKSYGFMVLNA